jgi:deoxyribodipyrimidine photo-lyase
MVALLWFRRDLRLHDHPALRAAVDTADRIVPVFCLDDRLLHGRHASGPRTAFLLDCLTDLDQQLAGRGARLVIRHGPAERELPALAAETGAGEVHLTSDPGPYRASQDRRVRAAVQQAGVGWYAHPGISVLDDVTALRTSQDRPYTVFTPFYRKWAAAARRPVLDPPGRIAMPAKARRGRVPALGRLGLRQEVAEPAPGGETAGLARLASFLDGPLRDYAQGRDLAGQDGSSRLSPYLRFGCLSPRAVEDQLPGTGAAAQGAAALRRQLCWRDFYQHVLAHHPANARQEFQPRYRGTLHWAADDAAFTAWTQGRTGFPLVDAGMRQLLREGWMHNRVRMVVGSFLTKDLGIDWRRGEAWFMRLLLDGDQASNNGNWQWIASVGADPQPVSRRIFSPARQQLRFDPHGRYVRAYLPELAQVPDEYLAEPWLMPAGEQQRAGCWIGPDYPAPIVDHPAARRAALDRYRAAGSLEWAPVSGSEHDDQHVAHDDAHRDVAAGGQPGGERRAAPGLAGLRRGPGQPKAGRLSARRRRRTGQREAGRLASGGRAGRVRRAGLGGGRGQRDRAGPPGAYRGQGGQPVRGPHHVGRHELGQQDGEQREADPACRGGAYAHHVSSAAARAARQGRLGHRDQHVHHGAGHHQVRQMVRTGRGQPARRAVEPADPPAEPHGETTEHHGPPAGPPRRVPQRAAAQQGDPGHQHPGHGQAHQHVHEIDVTLGRPLLDPGQNQPAGAVAGHQQHRTGKQVRQPGRAGHVSAPWRVQPPGQPGQHPGQPAQANRRGPAGPAAGRCPGRCSSR